MSFSLQSIYAALPKTARGTPIVLGGDPKGKNFLYTSGHSVIIRNIENPAIVDEYTEHSTNVNVAKYSPSGFYIASGDQHGKIRIWDTVNKEHLLKNEFQPFGGPVKDLAWSPDSARIAAVGEGRERFGHVFLAETGTSVGEISGQSKAINSVDYRPTRPFRIVTGSEDNTVGVFEGPPFKFKMTKKDHSRFVQAVRYSPDGSKFASGGFDGKVFIFDGSSADLIGEVGSPAHNGGVYGVAWSGDGKQLLTASGDKTCKLWDVETRELISEFPMGNTVDDQQVSCLWQGPHLLSVSLSGFINYLDVNNPTKPLRVIKGHNKPITRLALGEDLRHIYTGGSDGWLTEWESETGRNERISGAGHGNQVQSMRVDGQRLITTGIDDSLRIVDLDTGSYGEKSSGISLGSQPRGLDVDGNKCFVVTVQEIIVFENGVKVGGTKINFDPSCLAYNSRDQELAVGSGSDNKVHLFMVSGRDVVKKDELSHLGGVTDVAYSPDFNYLAACDSHRKVVLYKCPSHELAHKKEWGFHNARVNCIAWSADSEHVASGSLDTNIIIWTVADPGKHLVIKNAHPQSQITGVGWAGHRRVVSCGQDGGVRLWTLSL